MTTTSLGKVSLAVKGEYNASTAYERLDVISYQGSSYIVKESCTGIIPEAGNTYLLASEKGDKGDKGERGIDGTYVQKAYKTYASMVADKGSIPTNSNVVVNNDPDKDKNAYYTYDGSEFTKSDFDPQGILTTVDVRLNQAVESASDYFQSQVADTIATSIDNSTVAYIAAINTTKAQVIADAKVATKSTLDIAVTDLFENGGLPATPFATKALMTASALVDGDYAMVTNDTVNNGLYVKTAGAWVKSAYDPLGQAKSYADASKLDLASIAYAYTDGNIVGNKIKTVEGRGLNSALNYVSGGQYASKILPVSAGYDLYVLNDKAIYSSGSGNGYAFFDDDPSVNQSAVRITDNRAAVVDTETSLNYSHVSVPDGAKYLVINSRFNTDTNWAIHKGAFSSSYEPGTEVLFSVNGATIEEQLKPSLINTLEQGNKLLGDLYQPSGVLYNYYLNTQNSLISKSTADDWRAFKFKVNEGSSYYLKIIGAQNFPFKVVYSKSFDGVSRDTTYAGSATLTLTNQENVYKLTVPTGLDIVAVFMNIKIDTSGYTFNITDTLSVQEGHFEDADIGRSGSGITSINGNAIVDTYARAKLDEQGSVESISRLSGKKVFALGDSMTAGYNGGYLKYLEAAFGTTVENYGSNGARTNRVVDILTSGSGIPNRYSSGEVNLHPEKDLTDLACVTLMIGTNDSDGAAVSSLADLENIPDDTDSVYNYENHLDYWAKFPRSYIGNIALCIEYIQWKSPTAEIHIIAPPYTYNTTLGKGRIERLQAPLKAICDKYSVHFINSTFESGITFKLMNPSLGIYSTDGIHLTAEGNKVFGEYVAAKVLSYG